MKIVGVKVLEFRRRLDGRSWNPTFRWRERRAPLLILETDSGLTGVGEAWSRQPRIALVLDHLAGHCAPALLGRDPLLRTQISAHLESAAAASEPWVAAAATSAIDIALWDLAAQAAGQPLWRALGGSSGRTAVYASGGLYRDGTSLKDLAHEFEAHADQGFTTVKMKLGALPLEADLQRVRSVRDAIGDEATLWVDAVNQLTRASAPAWCTALARVGVAAVQAPLPFDDVSGMADINGSLLPVIATEAEHREDAFRVLVEAKAVTYLQYCVGLCGGFSGAMRIDALAAEHAVSSTPQCFPPPCCRRPASTLARHAERHRSGIPSLSRSSRDSLACGHEKRQGGLCPSRRCARSRRVASDPRRTAVRRRGVPASAHRASQSTE
jgi:L-alanine-DL-glutamate epimerase-like enolase superfamily enzyme